jgi:hypothetical protein
MELTADRRLAADYTDFTDSVREEAKPDREVVMSGGLLSSLLSV